MQDELYGQVELAPDVEWLLLRDQENISDLLVHLVDEYGVGLSLLMQNLFGDSTEADKALVETLAQIVLQRSRYHSDRPVKVWLYSLALDSAWRLRRKLKNIEKRSGTVKKDAQSKILTSIALPEWLNALPEQIRLAVVLQRFLGLTLEEVANVLESPMAKITSDLAIVGKVFLPSNPRVNIVIEPDLRRQLIQLASHRLAMHHNHDRFRRTALEMSWAVGAILLVGFLTRIYDIRNPDPTRQAIEVPFLTPLPTSTNLPSPTATSIPLLNFESTSDEIALHYWQRSMTFNSIWEDAIVLLGGAQGSPTGHTVKRVEFGWDIKSRKMMMLVGPPDGPPENGLYADEGIYYELDIHNGNLVDISVLDLNQPKEWYYFASLPYNLQINNFEGNVWYRGLGSAQAANRDTLLVQVMNSHGTTELYTWLDAATAIPLRQQRFAEQGWERTTLVMDVIVDRVSIDEPFPSGYFNIETPRTLEFRASQERWWTDPAIAASLRWMERNFADSQRVNPDGKPQDQLNYKVKEISNQEGIKYSIEVFDGRDFLGEYPMGNPWSVQCERSPDGSRVAFIEDRRFEFGNTLPSQILHWFSINQPGYMETPLPEADTTRFAFSPDSNYLAVQASNDVSLIDLRNNKLTHLLKQSHVDVLAFSEDGHYLGVMLRPTSDGHSGRYWIIDIQAKQVLDAGPFDFQSSIEMNIDNSIANIDFGKTINFGLENCR